MGIRCSTVPSEHTQWTTSAAGCVGSQECGIMFDVGFKEPLESATFSYKFKFSAGFDWTSGGKLPGVCDLGTPSCSVAAARF